MSKTITVKAAPRPDFSGYWCAHRFFPNGTDVVLEVLDQEDDPPPVMRPDRYDRHVQVARPDPRRIGRRSERQLRANTAYLVVVDGGEMPDPVAVSEAEQLAELRQKVADLEKQLAEKAQKAGQRRGNPADQ